MSIQERRGIFQDARCELNPFLPVIERHRLMNLRMPMQRAGEFQCGAKGTGIALLNAHALARPLAAGWITHYQCAEAMCAGCVHQIAPALFILDTQCPSPALHGHAVELVLYTVHAAAQCRSMRFWLRSRHDAVRLVAKSGDVLRSEAQIQLHAGRRFE